MTNGLLSALWEPRIGADGVRILQAQRRVKLIAVAVLLVCGAVVGSHMSLAVRTAAGLTAVAGSVLFFSVIGRLNAKLRQSLTARLGAEVTASSNLSFRSPSRFDASLAAATSENPRRVYSFLGGFMKVTLPPK